MAKKKVFTDESLATFVDEIKNYTDSAVSTKAESGHKHTIEDVTNLQLELDTITEQVKEKADSSHTHIIDDVEDLQAALDTIVENSVGENTTGKEYTLGIEILTAKNGAEIFNDYENNIATGSYSHAEGRHTQALGDYSHAEGRNSVARGLYSHVQGLGTVTTGMYSHAEGEHTFAYGNVQHVQGKWNINDTDSYGNALNTYAHIVGNGTSDTARSNAHTLDWDGNAWFAGDVLVGGTSQNDETAKTLSTTEYVDNKLSEKANVTHTHNISDVTDLQSTLDALETIVNEKANKTHTHNISDITNLQITLDDKASQTDLDTLETVVNEKINNISWNDLEDKPFGEALINVLEFDGILDGKECIDLDSGFKCVKVYNNPIETSDLLGAVGVAVMANGSTMEATVAEENIFDSRLEDGTPLAIVAINGGQTPVMLIAYEDTIVEETSLSKGTYLVMVENQFYVNSVTFTKNIIILNDKFKTIDPKYLPEHLQFGETTNYLIPEGTMSDNSEADFNNVRVDYESNSIDLNKPIYTKIDDTVYESKLNFISNGMYGFGNYGLMLGTGEDNGEPYYGFFTDNMLVDSVEGYTLGIILVNGETQSVPISVWQGELKTIDAKYLPEHLQFGEILGDKLFTTITYKDDSSTSIKYYGSPDIAEQAYEIRMNNPYAVLSIDGKKYIVGTGKNEECYYYNGEVVLACEWEYGLSLNPQPLGLDGTPSSYEIALYKPSVIKTLDPKFLPETTKYQGDWNVNDETNPAYIANRPFYTGDPVETTIVEETTFELQDGIGQLIAIQPLEVGQEYNITLDGTTYNCVAKMHNALIYLGNAGLSGLGEDTGELFFVAPEYETELGITINSNVLEHTISISSMIPEIYKIDEKYLPNLVGKTTTGIEYTINDETVVAGVGAEIFNDYEYNIATGEYSHAEGSATKASGAQSHAEGSGTKASGYSSHAEGEGTTASGYSSHAEGTITKASGVHSHAEGFNTTASGNYQHVQGRFNVEDTSNKYAHIVGNGTTFNKRSNAHTLDWDGNAEFQGDVKANACGGENPISLVELYNTIQALQTTITDLQNRITELENNTITETELNNAATEVFE